MYAPVAPRRGAHNPLPRAYISFWVLVGVAVLMAGAVSAAFAAAPGPLMAVCFAGGSVLLVVCLALAARVLLAIQWARPDGRESAGDAERLSTDIGIAGL